MYIMHVPMGECHWRWPTCIKHNGDEIGGREGYVMQYIAPLRRYASTSPILSQWSPHTTPLKLHLELLDIHICTEHVNSS